MPLENSPLIPGYLTRPGSRRDFALLVRFMQRTYQELYPDQNFAHLAETVEQYFSEQTPLWWVEESKTVDQRPRQTVACLWLGSAVDQVRGDRHSHIFLLYVAPEYRRRGIGSALMQHTENWARVQGEHQIGLHVLQANTSALAFYHGLGYETQALWMVKLLVSPAQS